MSNTVRVICEDRRVKQGKGFERCYNVSRWRKELEDRERLKVLRKKENLIVHILRRDWKVCN